MPFNSVLVAVRNNLLENPAELAPGFESPDLLFHQFTPPSSCNSLA